eukprot:6385147-Prymnesium_polylepis.1
MCASDARCVCRCAVGAVGSVMSDDFGSSVSICCSLGLTRVFAKFPAVQRTATPKKGASLSFSVGGPPERSAGGENIVCRFTFTLCLGATYR